MSLAALLLGAGAGRRFGPGDKLRAPVDGAPLLSQSARALAGCGADHLIAVLRAPEQAALLPAGFHPVFCAGQLSDSLRAGLAAAEARGAEAVLIALADMPHLPPAHLRALITAMTGPPPTIAATQGPDGPMVPACFPRTHFPDLHALQGDRGAARGLRHAPALRLLPCPPAWLRDYDRPEDFKAAPPDKT